MSHDDEGSSDMVRSYGMWRAVRFESFTTTKAWVSENDEASGMDQPTSNLFVLMICLVCVGCSEASVRSASEGGSASSSTVDEPALGAPTMTPLGGLPVSGGQIDQPISAGGRTSHTSPSTAPVSAGGDDKTAGSQAYTAGQNVDSIAGLADALGGQSHDAAGHRAGMGGQLTGSAGQPTMEGGDSPVGGMADVSANQTPAERFTRRRIDLPFVYDFSGASSVRVDGLIRRALSGLGFQDGTGPNPLDRVFVNRFFIAWIDETGFYGKMNGLWPLNGDANHLDFVMLDGDRPVNALIVGERGMGSWPGGYMGSEHIEFPNNTPEEDDNPNCRNSFCAQYSHGEAHRYTVAGIPAWRACNEGSPNFGDRFVPILEQITEAGLRLVYRGPLTKQGDFGDSTNGNNCHRDFLFSNGQRRRVYLETGYIFGANTRFVDRTMQVDNPAGNPPFTGPYSFIGGFVFTSLPDPHPLKALNRFVRPVLRDVRINWGNQEPINAPAGQWTRLPRDIPDSDVVLGQAGQPLTLSPVAAQLYGQAFTIDNVGPQDNVDTGFCLCSVHGGIEMGGGLIPEPSIPGGERSPIGIRRLTIHHEDAPPAPARSYQYDAADDLSHEIGYADIDGWAANTADQNQGHLLYGPYARTWGEGLRVARFRMMIDVVNESPEVIARVDVFDADTQEVVAQKEVLRSDFSRPFNYTDIALQFDLVNRRGHAMETRVWWTDISYVRVQRVTIELSDGN